MKNANVRLSGERPKTLGSKEGGSREGGSREGGSREGGSKEDVQEARWQAVLTRTEGAFVYAVHTTGVFCRPSCSSRHAKRENVDFFETAAQAEKAGFRACHRCEPKLAPRADRQRLDVITLCRFIESSETPPSLAELATLLERSTSHTRRLFKDVTGLTPKEYTTSQLRKRIQVALASDQSITDAIFGAGYSSTSRFYEASDRLLGMTASEFRTGAQGHDIRFAVGDCSLGYVLVAATAIGVCAVLLGKDPDLLIADLTKRFPKATLLGGDEDFDTLAAAVIAFIEAPNKSHDLPLDVRGTAFQQRVWQALQEIPPGETATYSDVAKAIGSPSSVRAVASACGANAIAVLIPCHRVVRKGGGLSGYRWGVERKRALLQEESFLKNHSASNHSAKNNS